MVVPRILPVTLAKFAKMETVLSVVEEITIARLTKPASTPNVSTPARFKTLAVEMPNVDQWFTDPYVLVCKAIAEILTTIAPLFHLNRLKNVYKTRTAVTEGFAKPTDA